jgi:hypothetical protein
LEEGPRIPLGRISSPVRLWASAGLGVRDNDAWWHDAWQLGG